MSQSKEATFKRHEPFFNVVLEEIGKS
jgi:CheY-like chemotaxis protein